MGAMRSDAVRHVREVLGWSQDELARELETTVATVQEAETEGQLFKDGATARRFEEIAKEVGFYLRRTTE